MSLSVIIFVLVLMLLSLSSVFWFTVAGCMEDIIMHLSGRLSLISGMFCSSNTFDGPYLSGLGINWVDVLLTGVKMVIEFLSAFGGTN